MPFWQLKCCSATVRGPKCMPHQLKNVMNIWQKPILRKALTSFCILSEACLSSVFSSKITSFATAFDLQLL